MTIFYVHKGNPFYLKYSIAQTRQRFPEARIILLGDDSNTSLGRFAEHVPMDSYQSAGREFAERYVHLSPNSVDFELFCLQRWFLIEEFVRLNRIEGPLLHLDSDVLVYEDVFKDLPPRVTLATTRELGPAFTYFGDGSVLAGLTRFMREAYSGPTLETLRRIFETGESPFFLQGKYVSDMQLLGLYYRTLPDTVDLFRYRTDLAFDYAFHTAEGFSFNPYKRIKRVKWIEGQPFGKRGGQLVRFAGLHFQVGTKIYIPRYYRGPVLFPDRWANRMVHLRGALTTALKYLFDGGRKWRENQ